MKNLNKLHFYLVIVANESMSLDVILGRDFMDACNPNLNLDTVVSRHLAFFASRRA